MLSQLDCLHAQLRSLGRRRKRCVKKPLHITAVERARQKAVRRSVRRALAACEGEEALRIVGQGAHARGGHVQEVGGIGGAVADAQSQCRRPPDAGDATWVFAAGLRRNSWTVSAVPLKPPPMMAMA